MSSATEIENKFIELFKSKPQMVRAPGRINLMGEHMDYNLGISMSAAINREIYFATAKNNSSTHCSVYAFDYHELFEFDLNDLKPVPHHWSNYIAGVIFEIIHSGKNISGFDCVFGGNLPQGAGLSSSAATACGCAFSINELFNLQIEKIELAQIGLRAEHNFANVKCGLLDQFSSLLGKKNKALILDFKTFEFNYTDLNLGAYSILLFNTNVKHSLAKSGHLNERFESCHRGVTAIQKINSSVTCLRDADMKDLNSVQNQLTSVDYNRCKYVIEEMNRFYEAKFFLAENKLEAYGATLFKTHDGMKNLYEISCFELDVLINYAAKNQYIIGAKMMGGGYGGCTLNIVAKNHATAVKEEIENHYLATTRIQLDVYEIELVDGVSVL